MKKKLLSMLMVLTMVSVMFAGCAKEETSSGTTTNNDATVESDNSGSESSTTESSGGDASSEKVTIRLGWWGNQTRNERTQQVIELYMEQNPNVEIKPEFTDWTGYWDKMSAMAAGGNLPDVMQHDYAYLQQYQQSDQLADLSQFIDSGLIDTSRVAASIIQSGSVGGTCYGISLGSNAPIMIYDKGLVEEAGVEIPQQLTYDDLYTIGEQVYNATGSKTLFDASVNMLQIVARTDGALLFGELAEGDQTHVLELMEAVKKFQDAEFAVSPALLIEKNYEIVEQKPIIDQTTWNDFAFSNMFVAITNQVGRDLVMTMYPQPAGGEKEGMYLKPSMFFSIAKTSTVQEEAAKFIDWFTNSDEANAILGGERGIPINGDVQTSLKSGADDVTAAIYDYISAVGDVAEPIDPPNPPGASEINAELKTAVENVRYGDMTPEEAAASFTENAQRILAEAANQ